MSSSRHISPKFLTRHNTPEDNNKRNPQQGNSPGPSSSPPRYGHFIPPNTDHYPIPVPTSNPNFVVPNRYPEQGHLAPPGQYPGHGLQRHQDMYASNSYAPRQPHPVQYLQVPNVPHPYQPGFPEPQNVAGPSRPGPSRPGPSTMHGAPTPSKTPSPDRKVLKCSLCSKDFILRSSYNRHMQCQHDDPSFLCDHCDMSFKRKDKLKQHMKTHQPGKPQ